MSKVYIAKAKIIDIRAAEEAERKRQAKINRAFLRQLKQMVVRTND